MSQLYGGDWYAAGASDVANRGEDTDRQNDGGQEGDEVDYGCPVDVVRPGDDADETVLDLEQTDVNSSNKKSDQSGENGFLINYRGYYFKEQILIIRKR